MMMSPFNSHLAKIGVPRNFDAGGNQQPRYIDGPKAGMTMNEAHAAGLGYEPCSARHKPRTSKAPPPQYRRGSGACDAAACQAATGHGGGRWGRPATAVFDSTFARRSRTRSQEPRQERSPPRLPSSGTPIPPALPSPSTVPLYRRALLAALTVAVVAAPALATAAPAKQPPPPRSASSPAGCRTGPSMQTAQESWPTATWSTSRHRSGTAPPRNHDAKETGAGNAELVTALHAERIKVVPTVVNESPPPPWPHK